MEYLVSSVIKMMTSRSIVRQLSKKQQKSKSLNDQLLCSLLLSTGFLVPFPGMLGIVFEVNMAEKPFKQLGFSQWEF